MNEPDIVVLYAEGRVIEPVAARKRKVEVPRGRSLASGNFHAAGATEGQELGAQGFRALVDPYGRPIEPAENSSKKKDVESVTSSAGGNGHDADGVIASEAANDPGYLHPGEILTSASGRPVQPHEFLRTSNRNFTFGPAGLLRAVKVRQDLILICDGPLIIDLVFGHPDTLMAEAGKLLDEMQDEARQKMEAEENNR